MSLISIVLTLHAEEAATVPANLGRATHAWFLDQVRGLDPALADSLHAPNQERPFTVSNLWGPRVTREDPSGFGNPKGLALSPDRPCFLRLTSYEPALSALLADGLLPHLPETITLAETPLKLVEITTTAEQHPWAGQTTFSGLLQEHTLGQQPPRHSVSLRFGSPTVFKSQGNYLPLPLPRLVFEGLWRRWNTLAPAALPKEVIRFAEETMVISRYRLRTERVAFGADSPSDADHRGAYPGFLGQVAYGFTVKDRYWMGLIHTLAAFSLYAGVGQRVTMGLGQARKNW